MPDNFGQSGDNLQGFNQGNTAYTALLDAQRRRLERQRQGSSQGQRPTFSAEGGRIRTLGAAGAMQPRRSITSGGQPSGSLVATQQGLVSGMPAGNQTAQVIRELQRQIAQLDLASGAILLDVHPNNLDGSGTDDIANRQPPRRPGDMAIYQGIFYYWDLAERRWLGALEETTVPIPAVALQQYPVEGKSPWQRRIERLEITCRTQDGSLATPGAGTLLANGVAVNLGVTYLPVNGYLSLEVTDVGGGDFFIATILMRAA